MEDIAAATFRNDDREPVRFEPEAPHRRSLFCGACGYGIVRATPPGRCPMCQGDHAWVDAPPPSPTVLLIG